MASGFRNRKELGQPFQIRHNIENAGKNIASSKKKVYWEFGFTESEQRYEIILVHSVASGKKVISENGQEIASTEVLATDFSHGWQSATCPGRIFRIEADIGVTSDHTYTFSIDGTSFEKFLTRNDARQSQPRPVSTVSSSTAPAKPSRRVSINIKSSEGSTVKPPIPTAAPDLLDSGSFDPFASDAGSFEPFSTISTTKPPQAIEAPVSARSSNPSVSNTVKTKPPPTTSSTVRSAPVDLLDAPSEPSFDGDIFSSSGSSGSQASSYDPFASTPSASASVSSSNNNNSASNFLSFTPPPQTRRSSAVDISHDFAGLAFDTSSTTSGGGSGGGFGGFDSHHPGASAQLSFDAFDDDANDGGQTTTTTAAKEPIKENKWKDVSGLVNLDNQLTDKPHQYGAGGNIATNSLKSKTSLNDLMYSSPQHKNSSGTGLTPPPVAQASMGTNGGMMPSARQTTPVYGMGLMNSPPPVYAPHNTHPPPNPMMGGPMGASTGGSAMGEPANGMGGPGFSRMGGAPSAPVYGQGLMTRPPVPGGSAMGGSAMQGSGMMGGPVSGLIQSPSPAKYGGGNMGGMGMSNSTLDGSKPATKFEGAWKDAGGLVNFDLNDNRSKTSSHGTASEGFQKRVSLNDMMSSASSGGHMGATPFTAPRSGLEGMGYISKLTPIGSSMDSFAASNGSNGNNKSNPSSFDALQWKM